MEALRNLTNCTVILLLMTTGLSLSSCGTRIKAVTLWGHPDPNPVNDHPDVTEFLIDSLTTTTLRFTRTATGLHYSYDPTCKLTSDEGVYYEEVGGGNSVVTLDSLSLASVYAGASRYAVARHVVPNEAKGKHIIKVGVVQYDRHVRKFGGKHPRTLVVYRK